MNKKWNIRFIELTNLIRFWSKDNFKVGAVIVNDDRVVLSTGYNGFPRGFPDTLERLEDKETKRLYAIHAEENAILNAAKNGICINNSTIYISSFPCLNCAKRIVNSGIKEVITSTHEILNHEKHERYNFDKVVELFKICNIKLTYV